MTAGGEGVTAPVAAVDVSPGVLLPSWLDGTGPRVVLALLMLIAGIYLSKYVVHFLERPISRRFERESLVQMVLRSTRLVVVVLAAVAAAGLFGFRPTDLLISVTVFSAVLGLVLAPVIGNVINGLFVLADQPYEIGDLIELEDTDRTRGFVDDITLRYTKIFTLDNTFTVIPNETIRTQRVVNYSAEDERVRRSIPLLVTYGSDIEAARDLFERAARNCETVIEGGPDIRIGAARYPARPTAYIDQYADSGVRITLRYWAEKPYRLLTVRSEVQTAIREIMAESDADVEFAFPHRRLVFADEAAGPGGARPDDASREPEVGGPEDHRVPRPSRGEGTDD